MFSTTCEYALRALVRLAQMPNGSAILGRDLAQNAEIPANYLSKILLTLRNAGILTTARGTGGGYRLRKPAEEIRLIHVVELFDGARARPACLLGCKECSDEDPCSAHDLWRDVRAVYVNFLETTTLASISKDKNAAPAADSAAAS
ncbi:MAG: RrF2 family transcriptional regulator [Acidobacteriota bacterium]